MTEHEHIALTAIELVDRCGDLLSTFAPNRPQRFTPGAVRVLQMYRKANTKKAQSELGFKPSSLVKYSSVESFCAHCEYLSSPAPTATLFEPSASVVSGFLIAQTHNSSSL